MPPLRRALSMNQKQLREFGRRILENASYRDILKNNDVLTIINIVEALDQAVKLFRKIDKTITNCPHTFCFDAALLVDMDKLQKRIEMI
jgi:hypothetical protein